eukprot:TRINITY_DN2399_c0_g1_i8.p1 TRINITY_DN2399_c0_g1~~TRINITY_DN2399_c0_g1_i8.p1  ORF type:complete len:100 (-),score=20.49 TRINITY_DN2399_c0_g1_i8:74-328(-)
MKGAVCQHLNWTLQIADDVQLIGFPPLQLLQAPQFVEFCSCRETRREFLLINRDLFLLESNLKMEEPCLTTIFKRSLLFTSFFV